MTVFTQKYYRYYLLSSNRLSNINVYSNVIVLVNIDCDSMQKLSSSKECIQSPECVFVRTHACMCACVCACMRACNIGHRKINSELGIENYINVALVKKEDKLKLL